MKHPFTRTKSVFLLSSLHTLDYHLPRTNCLQGGKSNTRWLCYPLANNSIWCCCICLNVPSSGISFCTNFKFFYSVLYPVGPLDWYFKLLCCKLRNMVKYILLCYCWCLTFCLCYFFTFFFKVWSTASVPNANSYSSCSIFLVPGIFLYSIWGSSWSCSNIFSVFPHSCSMWDLYGNSRALRRFIE